MFLHQNITGQYLDPNGKFILVSYTVTLVLTVLWGMLLWNDPDLSVKYKNDTFYVPEPWAYYHMHVKEHLELT